MDHAVIYMTLAVLPQFLEQDDDKAQFCQVFQILQDPTKPGELTYAIFCVQPLIAIQAYVVAAYF
ncbi:hypothetical protein EBU02_04515 [bacterium]|nr:hypothetical protein [bacterium]